MTKYQDAHPLWCTGNRDRKQEEKGIQQRWKCPECNREFLTYSNKAAPRHFRDPTYSCGVYVLRLELPDEIPDWFKIGSSRAIEPRFRCIRSDYPGLVVELLHVIPMDEAKARAAESMVHAYLIAAGRKRARTDYFELQPDDVALIRSFGSFSDILDLMKRGGA